MGKLISLVWHILIIFPNSTRLRQKTKRFKSFKLEHHVSKSQICLYNWRRWGLPVSLRKSENTTKKVEIFLPIEITNSVKPMIFSVTFFIKRWLEYEMQTSQGSFCICVLLFWILASLTFTLRYLPCFFWEKYECNAKYLALLCKELLTKKSRKKLTFYFSPPQKWYNEMPLPRSPSGKLQILI